MVPGPNGYSPKWPQPQMATAPNGFSPKWLQPQMATAPNGYSPKWLKPPENPGTAWDHCHTGGGPPSLGGPTQLLRRVGRCVADTVKSTSRGHDCHRHTQLNLQRSRLTQTHLTQRPEVTIDTDTLNPTSRGHD